MRSRQQAVPDGRSMLVLVSLVVAMTLSSAVLLILEPGPISPPPSVITLGATSRSGDTDRNLFDTSVPQRNWSAIMIYESGSLIGSAQTIAAEHDQQGLGGLGYHFVIESDAPDDRDLIRAGFRWRRQLTGAHANGPNQEGTNQHAIGICLVGNSHEQSPSWSQMRVLVELIQRLQQRFHIPPHRVRLYRDHQTSLGKHFPVGWLRDQLLTPKN